MSLHNLGIADLPIRAFIRHGRNILPQGGKGSAPPAPDYRAAAEETASGNLEAAKYATQANRVNQYTPWGSLTWDSNRVFNQDAYDRDLAAYNQARADYQGQQSNQGNVYHQQYGYDPYSWGAANNNQAQMSAPVAPNAQDYYTGGDQWTQNVTLSPEVQALFDQGMRLERGMFGAQDAALGRVNQTLGRGFDMSGVPQGGTALNLNSLPAMGSALNMNSLPGMGQVFSPSGQQLPIYDPTQQTNNATELLMQRINPELDRQSEALRAQLANQGITQGSQAYANAMNQFGQQRNDAATQAALQGIGLGMQQQGLQFNQGLQNRQLTAAEQAQRYGQQTTNQQLAAALQAQQFGQQQGLRMGEAGLQNQQFSQSEQARNRAIQEQAYLRNLPLNELNALRTGTQVGMPQFPGYAQQATTGGPDMLGAAQNTYNAQLGASNAQNAAGAGMLGGLFSLGGTILGAPSTSVIGGLFGG